MPAQNPLYPALIEYSLDLIAAMNDRGAFIFQSPSVQRILGYKPQELVGKSAFDFVHPDDRERVKAEFDRANRTPGSPTIFIEYRFLHKDQSWRVLESVGSLVKTTDGSRVGIVNSRDITNQRTLLDQFRHVQQVATLGRMASSLVHEFHNALQIMMLSLELILESNAAPALVPELEGMKKAGQLATILARQVLDLSRARHSAPQPLEVNAAIASITPVLQRLVGRRIMLETSLTAEHDVICARFGALDQILVNLVSNARDAILEDGTISITTRDANHQLILEVTDSGAGIPQRMQARIFEAFFTTKTATNGTGLGLSTVRDIVEEGGGRVDVRSIVGSGTTFSISWPLAEGDPADVGTGEGSEKTGEEGTLSQGIDPGGLSGNR